MKRLLLISICMTTNWLSASENDGNLRRSIQPKKELNTYYRHPKIEELILKKQESTAPLKRLLEYIKKFRDDDISFNGKIKENLKSEIVKIIKKLKNQDYQNKVLVDLLLNELALGDGYDAAYLASLPFESKVDRLREYLDLFVAEFGVADNGSDSSDDGYILLQDESDDQPSKLAETPKYIKFELESLLAALNQAVLKEQKLKEQKEQKLKEQKAPFIRSTNQELISKYSKQIKEAKEALETGKKHWGTVLYDEDSQAKLIKKITVLEKEIKNKWPNVVKDYLLCKVSEDYSLYNNILKNNLDFISFITQNEPPQEILVSLLVKLSGRDQAQIVKMSLDEKAELLWDLLKAKIIKEMPRLTLLGSENSYEGLLDESEAYLEAKGLVVEAALEANQDWNNVAVVEYLMRNFMLKTDSEATYSDIINISFNDKIEFVKEYYLHNLIYL